MAHKCKCSVCGIEFDRDKIQAVKSGARRYAHYTCMPTGELVPLGPESDPDREKLIEYINTLFKEPNWKLINKQLKDYTEQEHYSYSGILKSLVYFYQVKKNSIEKAKNSIGIVPYIYQDAYNYYLSIFLAQQANESKTLTTTTTEYTIKAPKSKGMKHKILDWGNEE